VDEATKTESKDENAVTKGIQSVTGESGLSIMFVWLMIMAVAAVAIVYYLPAEMSGYATVPIVGVTEILLLVMGVHIGVIPSGVLIVFVVLSLGIIAMWVRQAVTGSWR